MTTTHIDHTAYPYIIDQILSYSTDDAFLAFHSTNKHYRAKLATWLSHASYYRHGPRDTTYRLVSKVARSPQPTFFIPALVQVLDLDDDTCWSQHDNIHPVDDRAHLAFTSLRIVRRFGAAALVTTPCNCSPQRPFSFPVPATMVDFVDLNTPAQMDLGSQVNTVPVVTERYILHLRWSSPVPIAQPLPCWSHTPRLDGRRRNLQFDIVLWPSVTTVKPSPHRAVQVVSAILKDVDMYRTHLSTRTKIFVKIVGVEAVDLASTPIAEDDDDDDDELLFLPTGDIDDFALHVASHLRTRVHEDVYSSISQDLMRVDFVTLAAWHASLGDDKAVLGEWPA